VNGDKFTTDYSVVQLKKQLFNNKYLFRNVQSGFRGLILVKNEGQPLWLPFINQLYVL